MNGNVDKLSKNWRFSANNSLRNMHRPTEYTEHSSANRQEDKLSLG